MYTIKENTENEIIINKSKFITFAYKVKGIEEVKNIIDKLKQEYNDATHHCYAYIINQYKKASDDGEPGHTAGLPILKVLEHKDLNNILIVVVRYFGGIKLGAGGLVRAYTNSCSEALNKTEIIPIVKEYKVRIEFDYKDVDKINYILKDYKITYKEFNKNIIYEFIYEEENFPEEIKKIILKEESIK